MDSKMAVDFALEQAKKRLRALSIMGEPFRPHAYIPLDISLDKIQEALKEMGYEGEMPEVPDDTQSIQALATMPLDFASKRKDQLNILGKLLAVVEIPRVVVVCDTKAPTENGAEVDTLCVASIDLQAPDLQVLVPYQKESDDDVTFGEEYRSEMATETLRDAVIEGFLEMEARIYIENHPETDPEKYVDSLPEKYPNVNGGLNGGKS